MFSCLRRFFQRLFGQAAPEAQKTSSTDSLRVDSMQAFFDSLEYRFVANLAKGADLTFQYDITGDDALQFYIHIVDGKLEKHLGIAAKPTAGIKSDSKDYLRIINGDLNANQAYFKGLMKLTGKKMAAQKLRKFVLIGAEADKHYAQLKASGKLPQKQAASAEAVKAPTIPAIAESLTAPYRLTYKYQRTTGPIIGRFLTGLRDGKIEGTKTKDGRVIVPAVEYDPQTSEPLSEFVEVGQTGTVTTWGWVETPRPTSPQQSPFAWALIKLDGADTAMLHTVAADRAERMQTGMRVRVEWAAERKGSIHDIACFVPEVAA